MQKFTSVRFPFVQQTQKRSSSALNHTIPYIDRTLQDDFMALEELGSELPEVGKQVQHIRHVYDRGRDKVRGIIHWRLRVTDLAQAQELVESLEWLNTPVPLRLRTIVFTSNAPVGARWKILIVSVVSSHALAPLGSSTPLWSFLWGINLILPALDRQAVLVDRLPR